MKLVISATMIMNIISKAKILAKLEKENKNKKPLSHHCRRCKKIDQFTLIQVHYLRMMVYFTSVIIKVII